jgi:heptosyltransferase-2
VGFAGQWRRWLLSEVVTPPPVWIRMRKRWPAEIRRLIGGQEPAGRPAPSRPREAHQIFHYLHLVAHLGAGPEPLAPRLCLSPAELAEARPRVQALAGEVTLPADKPWLGLNAGAEYGPAKRWPATRFVAVAREVSRRTGAVWLILGGPNDRPLAAAIQSSLPGAAMLAGRTSLRELMLALAACDLLLTNDTGPMHLAAALGTPVVAIFGSTSPELTGPGLPGEPRHQILRSGAPCSPCFLRECPIDFRCMKGVTVERVTAAVLGRLARERERG